MGRGAFALIAVVGIVFFQGNLALFRHRTIRPVFSAAVVASFDFQVSGVVLVSKFPGDYAEVVRL